jgi:iron complex outermembrane receptor protein
MSTFKCSCVAAIGLLVSAFAMEAAAEVSATVTTEQSSGDQSEIPEILVTARRRTENLQTTPVSITALLAQALQSANVQDLTDLTRVTPGMRFTGEGSGYNTDVTLRGVGKNAASSASSPSVVLYFADIPRTGEAQALPVYDLEDVQVLKGPQGTLFGRNALGGAILVNPKQPGFNNDGYVTASVGNFKYSALEGAVNVPIASDIAALRVAGQLNRRAGFARDLTYGEKLENLDQNSVRVSLLLQLTDRITNTTIGDYFDAHEAGNAFVLVGVRTGIVPFIDPLLQASLAQQQANGPRNVASAVPNPFINISNVMVVNTTKFTVNSDFSIKNIMGLQRNKESIRQNSDGLNIPGIILNKIYVSNVYTQSFSEELQFAGKTLNDKLDYIGGLFYSNQTPAGTQGTNSTSFSFFNSSPATATSTYLKIRSEAVYGQVGFDLSSIATGLKLDAGFRYTWEQMRQCGDTFLNPINISDFISYDGCNQLASLNQPGLGILQLKERAPTWTIGLDYQASGRVFLYAVTRRGFREGGINSPLFDTPNTTINGPGQRNLQPYQTWGPETLTDVELGAKTNWQIGSAIGKVNIAVYQGKYKNEVQSINVTGLVNPDAGFPQFASFGYNSGDLTISGVDLDVSISPVRGLTFSGNAAYVNQKVDSINTIPPFPTPAVNLPSPRLSYTLAGDWVIPFRPLRTEIAAHADFFYTQQYQIQTAEVPGYQLTNARLDFNRINGTGFSASLFLINAFDKIYIKAPSIVSPAFPSNTATFGEPRMYGAAFSYRF